MHAASAATGRFGRDADDDEPFDPCSLDDLPEPPADDGGPEPDDDEGFPF